MKEIAGDKVEAPEAKAKGDKREAPVAKAKVVTICKADDNDAWKAKIPAADGLEHFRVGETQGKELLKEFEIRGFPFAVLVGTSGLIAWSGHPADRDLKEDMAELRKGNMLFETEDIHDDPDQPRRDPDEAELQKDLDIAPRRPKPMKDVLKDTKDKMEFYLEKIKSQDFEIVIVEDDKKEEKAVPKEVKKIHPLGHLQKLVKEQKFKRAFLVLRSEVIVQLDELDPDVPKDPKYEPRIILHAVFQGSDVSNEMMRKEIKFITTAIKKKWREKKNHELKSDDLKTEGEQDQHIEDCKIGWSFRNLYIKDETQ